MHDEDFPEKVRISFGSAIILGLMKSIVDAEPTTIYMLTYSPNRCSANCAFCPQARESKGRSDMLSRVIWPVFKTEDVLPRVEGAYKSGRIRRVCIQALNHPSVQNDILGLAKAIRSRSDVPISVSCQPLDKGKMLKLAQIGVERVSIALDASTKEIFEKIKGIGVGGPYMWEGHLKALEEAVQIFGRNFVTTHLIAGLGEREEEIIRMVQRCVDIGVYPSLFAFTPIFGTSMANHPRPTLNSYRGIQAAHYIIVNLMGRYEDMKFENGRLTSFGVSEPLLRGIIRTGEPFRTSGCPGCNRPYYNEKPGGSIYNYPRKPRPEEILEIERQMSF